MFELPPAAVALIEVWPKELAQSRNGIGACIETTRIVLPVLKRLGVDARPMPCGVASMNSVAQQLIHAGDLDADNWPADAWSVGINPDAPVPPTPALSLNEPHRRSGGWRGHLVVAGDDWFFDMTADQMSRPDKGIVIDGCIWGPWFADDGIEISLPDGGAIRYYWRPELSAYRNSPAWRQDVPDRIVNLVAGRARERMAETGVAARGT